MRGSVAVNGAFVEIESLDNDVTELASEFVSALKGATGNKQREISCTIIVSNCDEFQ